MSTSDRESAWRQTKKEQALQEAEAERDWIERQRRRREEEARQGSDSQQPRSGSTPSSPSRPTPKRRPAQGKSQASKPSGAKKASKRRAKAKTGRAKPASTKRAPAKKADGAQPTPKKRGPVKTTASRAFLESSEMDLFEKGTDPKLAGCPHCRHELRTIVHIEREVRVCLHCRGVFLPYTAWREFASKSDWFLQLAPAIRRHSERQAEPQV